MSAETLRRAAALMRERAEGATPGPWTCYGDMLVWPSEQGPAANDPIFAGIGAAHDASAEHVASWHPAVALAVADQLDGMAAVVDEAADGPLAIVAAGLAEKSLAVARAYLGESA